MLFPSSRRFHFIDDFWKCCNFSATSEPDVSFSRILHLKCPLYVRWYIMHSKYTTYNATLNGPFKTHHLFHVGRRVNRTNEMNKAEPKILKIWSCEWKLICSVRFGLAMIVVCSSSLKLEVYGMIVKLDYLEIHRMISSVQPISSSSST